MPVTEIGDPRLQALFGANDPRDSGIQPVVRRPGKGLPPLAIGAGALLLALLLFVALDSRRTAEREPALETARQPGPGTWEAPPPLYVPPAILPAVAPPAVVEQPAQEPKVAAPPVPAPAPRPAPQAFYPPQPMPQVAPPPIPLQQPRRSSTGAPLVIDTGTGPANGAAPAGSAASLAPSGTSSRMRASALANRATTVPQGTMIPAVLETAFNSTQPGFARAIVSRDVRSFDGTNVVIPRGSRLIGEYRSDVAQGQKRAVIIWSRLVRPDGMTIAIDSPAVDTMGRGGVPASVNTHFWQRLGDALLQTTVGLGSALAQHSVTGPVVLVSGSSGQAASQLTPTNSYVPTLTVPAGKSISIFVAHDLDFTVAGGTR